MVKDWTQRYSAWLKGFLFGDVRFTESDEYHEFRYKFLILLMFSGAVFTGLFILGVASDINPIGRIHFASMVFFTCSTTVIWRWLRGHPHRFYIAAWVYEIVGLWEYTSSVIYVPSDELRLLWLFVNVPGVFILLGKRAGWIITIAIMIGLGFGNAHLSHPYSPNAMATALLSILYLGVFFHAYVDRSFSYFKRMRDYNVRLQQLASHDPLTGVMNARSYYAACNQQIQVCSRSRQPVSVLFVDLDHFKSINDTHGHAAGDEVLRVVAQVLMQNIRRSDLLGRIGGEEFSILLPNTDLLGALDLAEQLRKAIESLQPQIGGQTLHITASIGVAIRSASEQTMESIQQQADAAMYEAKRGGRNRVSTLSPV